MTPLWAAAAAPSPSPTRVSLLIVLVFVVFPGHLLAFLSSPRAAAKLVRWPQNALQSGEGGATRIRTNNSRSSSRCGLRMKVFEGAKTIAVDYGTKRAGLAISMGMHPRPVTTIPNLKGDRHLAKKVMLHGRVEDTTNFIVGLPLDVDGEENYMTELTRAFALELANSLALAGTKAKVYMWDERYTSKMAEAWAENKDKSSGDKDSLAAVSMLQDYFETEGRGAERVKVDDATREIVTKRLLASAASAKAGRQAERRRERTLERVDNGGRKTRLPRGAAPPGSATGAAIAGRGASAAVRTKAAAAAAAAGAAATVGDTAGQEQHEQT